MALLTVQDASGGATFTLEAAAAGGDTIPQGGAAGGWSLGTFLLVSNAHTGPQTVTVEGLPGIPVAAGDVAVIPVHGFYEKNRAVTYSGVTALTVAAVRMAGS